MKKIPVRLMLDTWPIEIFGRHSHEGGNLSLWLFSLIQDSKNHNVFIPVGSNQSKIHNVWIPACAGMTETIITDPLINNARNDRV